MSWSDSDRSRDTSPIPWKDMFRTSSGSLPQPVPLSLTPSRSSPALGYVSQSTVKANPPLHQEARKPPRSKKRESSTDAQPRVPLLSFISNGRTSSDPSPSIMSVEKLRLADRVNGICTNRDQTSESMHEQNSACSSQQEQLVEPNTSPQQNFQLAVYIAMAHAVLIFLVMVLYGIWKLLECYRKPIQWAVLCSMPLRAIHGTIVGFWERSLNQGLIGTVLAVPFAICGALISTALDARLAFLHGLAFLHIVGEARAKRGRTVKFSTLMEWLVSFAVVTLAYQRIGLSFLFVVPFAVMTSYSIGTALGLVPVILDLETQTTRSILNTGPSRRWQDAKSWLGWMFSPFTEAYKLLGTRLKRLFLNNLHHMVAIFLILVMIVGSLSGLILFSYKIGLEGKDAVVGLKTHVQRSNYVERVGLKQWIEENNVPELIDTYTSKAYETISSQIDFFAAKYQMTEFADVGKQYLIRIAQGQRKGNLTNGLEFSPETIPSHPVFEVLRSVRQRFREYDFKGAYSELQQGVFILLEHFNIPKEDLFDKVKQAGERWLGVGTHVFVNSSKLVSGLMALLISITGSVLSGAPEIINFCANAFVFFSVLHYLIASKSGGVMEQVLSMLPLSESTRDRCAIVLDNAVSSVLLATVKAAFFQATFTWLLFQVLKIHFLYMSTLLSFFSAILPIIPTWSSSLPAGAQLAIEGHYIQAVLVTALHIGLMDFGVSAIQSGIPGHNAYLTGLSLAGGMALFSSAIEGAIMGPLLMTVAISLKNLYSEFVLTTAKKQC